MPPILVAVCSLGQVRIEHSIGFSAQQEPLGKLVVNMAWIGLPTQEARNAAALEAETKNFEYLMFYDDDMVPRTPDAVRLMHATMLQNPHIDVLGAVYPRRGSYPEPIVIREYADGIWWGWQDGGVHEVYCTGTGFTMFRVESMKKINAPQYELPNGAIAKKYFTLGHNVTDEFSFVELSSKAGLRWYVTGAVIADQINIDGRRFNVDDARITAPAPRPKPFKKNSRKNGKTPSPRRRAPVR